ncbi:DUF6461 domain-containing protein [Nonomuraea sp. NPDC026600]|uniref:DUF6461 domain-containing protein n=1 Tax=Nonomuraea sp. NPDC026600 TaxID=3155363 RepID=UPI003409C0F8
MIATAADYVWFYDRFPSLVEGYCFTLIEGVRPEDVVARLGARTEDVVARLGAWIENVPSGMSFDDVIGATCSGPGQYGAWDGHFFGAVAVEDWCLIVEPNGGMGITREIMEPLSAGTRLVSHYRNVNAVSYFFWVEDGEIRLSFEPAIPDYRYGSDPDGLVEVMRQVGFDLQDGDQPDGIDPVDDFAARIGTVFALAEHLTGVKLTAQLLEESTYLCAVAPSTN